MNKIRIYSALSAFVLGLVIASIQGVDGNWISATSAITSGTVISLIFLLGIEQSKSSSLLLVLIALSGLFSVSAVFFEHRAFDSSNSFAHTEALTAILEANTYCSFLDSKLLSNDVKACATQDIKNMQNAIWELNKAKYLDPATGLLDKAITYNSDMGFNDCTEAFRAIEKQCPSIKILVSEESK